MTSSIKRQAWLEDAVTFLRPIFKEQGATVPDNVRVSIGWPRGHHGRGKAIGQCWDALASTDKHHEVFVSPALKKSDVILGVLAHELVHATVGCKAGHKGPFKQLAMAIGLEGKMTATTVGKGLNETLKRFVQSHGEYPAGALIEGAGRTKQTTRLIKCECPACGYVARVTRKWIEDVGPPVCPADEVALLPADYDDPDEG